MNFSDRPEPLLLPIPHDDDEEIELEPLGPSQEILEAPTLEASEQGAAQLDQEVPEQQQIGGIFGLGRRFGVPTSPTPQFTPVPPGNNAGETSNSNAAQSMDPLSSIPNVIRASMAEYHRREMLMTVGGQTRVEIRIAPPLEEVLKVYLPEDQAKQLAEMVTAESKVAEEKAEELNKQLLDMFKLDEEKISRSKTLLNAIKDFESRKQYAQGLSAVLTRSLSTPEFKANPVAFKKRWETVLTVMKKDKDTRDNMLPIAQNFLGNCLEPMLNALEGFVKNYERRLVQHDPIAIITYTEKNSEENYKRNMLGLMVEILRPVASAKEITETYTELEVHLGKALGMENAASKMKYDGVGGTRAYRSHFLAIGKALMIGDIEAAQQAMQPLSSLIDGKVKEKEKEKDIRRYYSDDQEMNDALNELSSTHENSKAIADELVKNPYHKDQEIKLALEVYATNLIEDYLVAQFSNINKQIESLNTQLKIQKKEIDELAKVPDAPPFKPNEEMTEEQYKEKYKNELQAAEDYNQGIIKYAEIEDPLKELREKKKVETKKIIDNIVAQMMIVKDETEQQLQALAPGEPFRYQPLSKLTSQLFDKTVLKIPEVEIALIKMQFQMARNAEKKITLPSDLIQSEFLNARYAAQLAGVALTGTVRHKYKMTAKEETTFQTELNKKLIKVLRDMPEEALRKQFTIIDENASNTFDCKGGNTLKRDSTGNSFVRYSSQSRVPKLIKASDSLQRMHNIELQPDAVEKIKSSLKVGGKQKDKAGQLKSGKTISF